MCRLYKLLLLPRKSAMKNGEKILLLHTQRMTFSTIKDMENSSALLKILSNLDHIWYEKNTNNNG